jgi:hypothetical protein
MWFMLPVQYGDEVGARGSREWWLIPRKVTLVSEGEWRTSTERHGLFLSPPQISFGTEGRRATIICENILQVPENMVESVTAQMIAKYTGKVWNERLLDPTRN